MSKAITEERRHNIENAMKIVHNKVSSRTPYWYKLNELVEKIKDYNKKSSMNDKVESLSHRRRPTMKKNQNNFSRARFNSTNSNLKNKKLALTKIRATNLLLSEPK